MPRLYSLKRMHAAALSAWLCCAFLIPAQARAAEAEIPFERGLERVRNELLCARGGLRALSIAAHPDDEDGGTLSHLRRTLGVETHMCLATRGEGGQNESGPELGAALAVIRTQETEAAAAILGAKTWYLNLPDFGYSKNPEETLKVWGHEHALGQMVRVIRIVRPHVVFMNHDPDGTDHGHHRATGKLAVEAFDAAADPARFAAQMKEDGTLAWAASKLYVRRFAPPGATVIFDVSARDPLSGVSATEIAAHALARHASQGMSRDIRAGQKDPRYFTLLKSRLPQREKESTLLDGIEPGPSPAREPIDLALKLLSDAALRDGALARAIAAAYGAEAKQEKPDAGIRAHLGSALSEALGLRVEVHADDALVTYGETASISARLANSGAAKIRAKLDPLAAESPAWEVTPAAEAVDIPSGGAADFQATASARTQAYPTWPAAEYIFSRMEWRRPLNARFTVSAPELGVEFPLSAPAPLDLAPPHEATLAPDPVLIFDDPARDDAFLLLGKFRLMVTNHRRVQEPLKLFAGIQPVNDAPLDRVATLIFRQQEEAQAEEFRFVAPVEKLNQGDLKVPTAVWTAKSNFGGPVARLRRVPLKLPPVLNVGLVKTYDDSTLQALRNLEAAGLGLTLTLLSPDDLRGADLNKFHTIVLDIRATQYRPEVRHVKERLARFMNDGGNIVCMYHKDFDWNTPDKDEPLRGQGFFRGTSGGGEIAPYPIELSFKRVTDETAPVRFLKPDHPLLLQPCKITERDFQDWVQERGVYFPSRWDPHYAALLSTNDSGEAPLDGGLLVADVGGGSFIYTSFVWYRQLRTGNPGAYRLLANLLSYAREKRK